MGPLELADFIGLDVCLHVMEVLHDGFGAAAHGPAARPAPARRRRPPGPEDRPRLLHLPALELASPIRRRLAPGPSRSRGPDRRRSGDLLQGRRLLRDTVRDSPPRGRAGRRQSATRRSATTARSSTAWPARPDGRAVPGGDRGRRLQLPRVDAGDGGDRLRRHGPGRVAVRPHPVAVPGHHVGDATNRRRAGCRTCSRARRWALLR